MMSTRSPASSLVTAVTREPRMPMHVPCGSRRGSLDSRRSSRGCRVARRRLISINPSSISGTSSSNRRTRKPRDARRISRGPWGGRSSSRRRARGRPRAIPSDQLVARDHAFDAAGFDDDVAALDALDRAVRRLSSRSRKSFRICSRSASRIFAGSSFRRLRADAAELDRLQRLDHVAERKSGSRSAASVIAIWCAGSSCSSSGTTVQRRNDS